MTMACAMERTPPASAMIVTSAMPVMSADRGDDHAYKWVQRRPRGVGQQAVLSRDGARCAWCGGRHGYLAPGAAAHRGLIDTSSRDAKRPRSGPSRAAPR